MTEAARGTRTFHHAGLRATEPQPEEDFVVLTRVWVTDPRKHPNKVEHLRYEPESPLPDEFKDSPHIADKVDDLNAHVAGKDVVLLFEAGEPALAKVAFVREDGVYVEYVQFKPGRTWFTG
ncbi:MAG TPA: hypothetical protein VH482_35365 [Thermomicrobiales bacterium]|jgi:hypothetical protein